VKGWRRLPSVGEVVCACCGALCWALLSLPGPASAATVADLAARYDEAIRLVEAARDTGTPLADPAPLFPEHEAVSAGAETLQADHAGLLAEWRAVPADGDARHQALERLRARLQAVRAELGVGEDATATGAEAAASDRGVPPGWRDKLTAILRSPEFKKREARESPLVLLLRWLLDKLGALLPEGTATAIGTAARWIVYALAALALLAVLVLLGRVIWPLFQRERPATSGTAAAKPSADTPETLLALAESRRRAGDLRGAVQSLFRWLLVTLHQAGRLEYDPALTNREHLARLKADGRTRAAFAEVAAAFEMAWYAQQSVSPEDFGTFRSRCVALSRGRP
jgi:hypothetical protein